MSIEAVIAIVSTGFSIAAAGAVVAGFLRALHRDIGNLYKDLGKVAERVARIEGMLDGWRDTIRETVREVLEERERRGVEAAN